MLRSKGDELRRPGGELRSKGDELRRLGPDPPHPAADLPFLYETTDPIALQIDRTCTGPALSRFDGGSALGASCYGRFVGCAQAVTSAAATAAKNPFAQPADAKVPAACEPDGG